MPKYSRQECELFLEKVLGAVYGEADDLIGRPTPDDPRKPRSTERAIVARMAVHAEHLVKHVFTSNSVADVEYERSGTGVAPKTAWEHTPDARKMSPDLIVHERTNRTANYLAIEIKRATMARGRQWPGGPDIRDLDKLTYITHLTDLTRYAPQRQRSYQWGAYVELDRTGAWIWWLAADRIANPVPNGTARHDVLGPFRWDR